MFPLDIAYARAGLDPPTAIAIEPAAIPAPYGALLTHEQDMTGTLERYHGRRLVTRPLSAALRGRWYARHVLLARTDSGRPVAMGAIRVRLDAFGASVQALIRKSETPFGRILAQSGLDFRSKPKVFFELIPNGEMMGVFWMAGPQALYGRRTELVLDGEKIGDVVEVLPLV